MKTGEELGKTAAARSPKVRGWLVPSLQLRIRIQHFRSLRIQMRIRIRIRMRIRILGFDGQHFKRVCNENVLKYFLIKNFIFTYPWTSIKGVLASEQKKPSALKREYPAPLNMKFFNFFLRGSFLPSWIQIRIRNVNPDPADNSQCGSESGSATLKCTLILSLDPD
jgi:hypothetical protein